MSGDEATLYWAWPARGVGSYVRISQQPYSISGSGPGAEVNIRVGRASSGQLFEGSSPGDVLIYWHSGTSRCRELVLELSSDHLSREKAKSTVVRIAESLGPSN
jgi:hypothetical protein